MATAGCWDVWTVEQSAAARAGTTAASWVGDSAEPWAGERVDSTAAATAGGTAANSESWRAVQMVGDSVVSTALQRVVLMVDWKAASLVYVRVEKSAVCSVVCSAARWVRD